MADSIPTTEQIVVREAGLTGALPSPPVGELPPGGGKWAVPHHLTKVGLINQIARAYRWTYDEALKNSRSSAVAMLRDLVIRDAFFLRITPTIQLSWHLEAQDESDPKQVDAIEKLTGVIKQTPHLQDLFRSLMWAVWYGRAGAQLTYEWDWTHPDGERRLVVKDHRPINGDSLIAHWSGDWGVYVNGMYHGDNKTQGERGFEAYFTPEQRESVLIHTHCPEDADFYEPELAGQIRGSGVRGHVYWFWYLRSNFLALAADYAERLANGVWIAWYDESNPESKTELENSLAAYKNNHILEFPRNKQNQATAYGIDIKEVSTATPTFILELITSYFDKYIYHYVSGGSIADGAEMNVGGDGVALHEDQIGMGRKADAQRLAETLSMEWLPILTKYNTPNVPPPRFVFDIDRPDAGELIGYAKDIAELGGDINLDQLREAAGLAPPGPGDTASKLQPMSPVAAAQQPNDVPMAGPPGPQPVGQPQQEVATAPAAA